MLKNPWLDLPDQKPYVLPCDQPFIAAFNATLATRKSKNRQIRTELLPGPFDGNLAAPVVVLLLNPGFSKNDERFHKNADYQAAIRQTLSGQATGLFHAAGGWSDSPGHQWWSRVTRELRDHAGEDAVARNLLAIEFMPYHSVSGGHSTLRLPSQEFTFSLVRSAIARSALIICVRGYDHWLGAVPALHGYPLLARTRNPRCAHLSSRNLSKSHFKALLQHIT